MAKSSLVVVWMFALALIAFGDAELWHLLDWPLTIATWVVAIGTLALGVGSIIHSGV